MTVTTYSPAEIDAITTFFGHAPQIDPIVGVTSNGREAFVVASVAYQADPYDADGARHIRYRIYAVELTGPHAGDAEQLMDDYRTQAEAQAAVDEYLRRG